MISMQNEEEKDHRTMWNKRKAIIQRTGDRYIAISSEIDAIIHGKLLFSSKPKGFLNRGDE